MRDMLVKINIILFIKKEEEYDVQIVKSTVLAKDQGYSKAIKEIFKPRNDNAKLNQDILDMIFYPCIQC